MGETWKERDGKERDGKEGDEREGEGGNREGWQDLTFCPAMIHSDSVSTALDSFRHLSKILVTSTDKLDCLHVREKKHLKNPSQTFKLVLTFRPRRMEMPWGTALR